MISKGYVAVFQTPLLEEEIRAFVNVWLAGYDRVEQVHPGPQAGTSTFIVETDKDITWAPHLQFRISAGPDFTWVYLSKGSRVLETSGLPYEDNLLPLEVLTELPGIEEVVDDQNEKRLDELEAQGLIL